MKKCLWAVCMLLLCAATSCKKDAAEEPNGAGNGSGNPGQELPPGALCKAGTPVPGTLLQKEIGAAGGEFVMGNVKFIVPAGAFSKPVAFKIQRLLNTAPNGIDSMAFRFETAEGVESSKPIKMIYTFPRDPDGKPFVPGGEPKVLGGVAVHKLEAGKTAGEYVKQPGKPVIDEAAGTATMEYPMKITNGKFDIAAFLKYKLWVDFKDNDKVSSAPVVCSDKLYFNVTKLGIDSIVSDLFVPLPEEKPVDGKDNSYITNIYINGVREGTATTIGRILPGRTGNHFNYEAPYVVPGGPEKTEKYFTISLDILAVKNDVSKYYLVSHVKLFNESTIGVKGRVVRNVRHSATEESARKYLGIMLSNQDNLGTRAEVSLYIRDIFDGAGTYQFSNFQNIVSASASNGDALYGISAKEAGTNTVPQYASGNIKITTYDRNKNIIAGTYDMTLLREVNGKVESAPVTGKFRIPLVVAN
ncbi:hypothetical protein [Paraflavitalea sp. CAU 1676]|uniref:hypothetical protein n=1 Tax=Paraflavitalea sp. CAU 1676 TaxID=3032598 RepID=UPI0023DB0A90|nr:hypothetical protein [Paraflavitalea sp. CAU 1676]MDF2188002.1 hypothetical protein [Paraflavitalea sp. CAU 1676]